MATIRELIVDATKRLDATSLSPRLDAELLLSDAMHITRTKLIAEFRSPVSDEVTAQFEARVARRLLHEPVAYILGRKEFYGFDFFVTPSVLVPRPETESIVEDALLWAGERARPLRVLDLGTGSGCLAITLANALAARGRLDGRVVAVDLSEDALLVARKNATHLAAQSLVEFRQGSWFSALDEGGGPFDIIVSNPPYIGESDARRSPETEWEPRMALLSGEDGLTDIRHILSGVSTVLRSPGLFLLEVGASQRRAIENLCSSSFESVAHSIDISWIPDIAGHDRVLRVEFRPSK